MNTLKERQPTLTNKQQEIYEYAVYKKKNIFITGPGGTGKSLVIKKIYRDISNVNNVALTSLTGISANIIGGRTIHSYLGIGLGTDSFSKLYKKISTSKFLLHRWKRLNVLLIDEISMMSLKLFNKLERLARHIRENKKPFGGIQLILSGDFLQLPCVQSDSFCFESPKWNKCIHKIFYLTEIIRQTNADFSRVLSKIRIGNIDNEVRDIIQSRNIKYIPSGDEYKLIPTMLFSTNAKVDILNNKYYSKLNGEEHVYNIKFNWFKQVRDKEIYENLAKLPYDLKLKVGAQVMYLVNKDDLFNGSRGIVIDFIDNYPLVLFANGLTQIITPCCLDIEENDQTIMSYSQLPLKLSWAISIHKSQGCTLDLVKIDLKHVFEYGQLYVALSRCSSLNGLYIKNLDWNLVKINPKALQFYKSVT